MVTKRDVLSFISGVGFSEIFKKITGNTLTETLSHYMSKRKDAIEMLIDCGEDLTEDEKNEIREALKVDSVFRIVFEIDNPELLIDKELNRKAELKLKEIENKDIETFNFIGTMRISRTFGVSRLNRMNRFIIGHETDEIIELCNYLKKKFPQDGTKNNHLKRCEAFDFDPRREDESESIAYDIMRLINRKQTEIASVILSIMLELNEKFGNEYGDKFIKFISALAEKDPEKSKKIRRSLYNKYRSSKESTLSYVKEGLDIDKSVLRKKYFELG